MESKGEILIAEDSKFDRATIINAIGELFEVTVVNNGEEFLHLFTKSDSWDLVVLDINMPRLNGLEAAEKIIEGNKDIRVMIFTGEEHPVIINRAYDIGVCGILLKQETEPEDLIYAIKKVLAGVKFFGPGVTEIITPKQFERRQFLSKTHLEICRLLKLGKSNAEIAAERFVSVKTTANQISEIYKILDVKSDRECLALLNNWGMF